MNQNLLQLRWFGFSPPLFYFLIFSLLSTTPALSADPYFGTCVPERCNKGPNISFPFYISGKHPPHCGYPGFQLTCENQEPILKGSISEYIIRDIFYESQSLSLINKRWVDNDMYCPVFRFILTFNLSLFRLGESNLKLFFFYNCTQQQPHQYPYQPIHCLSNETHHAFARLDLTGSLVNSSNLPKTCGSFASVPVMMNSKPEDGYLNLLKRGFFLNWIAPNCRRCLKSGGQCGYLENEFKYFSHDRTRRVKCEAL